MALHHAPITVRSPDTHALAALITTAAPLRTPDDLAGLHLAVLCHGFQDSKSGRLMTHLAERLPCATLRLDFAGCGQSEGVFRYADYRRQAADLRAVVQHVRACGATVHAVLGHSKGAAAALLYAAEHADVPVVLNLAARYDMRRGVASRFGPQRYEALLAAGQITVAGTRNGAQFSYVVTRDDLEERFALDMAAVAERIPQHVRVLTIHGDADEIIPVDDARQIHRRLRNGQLVIVPQCGHSFRGFEDRVVDEIVRFGIQPSDA